MNYLDNAEAGQRWEAEAAILAHAERLESGELEWVRGTPCKPHTACMIYANYSDKYGHVKHSIQADTELGRLLAEEVMDDEVNARGCEDVTFWNDLTCDNKEEAIDFLKHAAKRVWQ